VVRGGKAVSTMCRKFLGRAPHLMVRGENRLEPFADAFRPRRPAALGKSEVHAQGKRESFPLFGSHVPRSQIRDIRRGCIFLLAQWRSRWIEPWAQHGLRRPG